MSTKKNTAPSDPVDLNQFDKMVENQEEGILIPIKGADGRSELGFSIRVAGPDSQRAQQALDVIQQELLDQEALEPATNSEAALRRMRYFAMVTMDFVAAEREDGSKPEHAMQLDGAPLPFSENNALRLYQRFRFIYQQVVAKADTRAAFLNGSSNDSASA
jgi:hypothetical protein